MAFHTYDIAERHTPTRPRHKGLTQGSGKFVMFCLTCSLSSKITYLMSFPIGISGSSWPVLQRMHVISQSTSRKTKKTPWIFWKSHPTNGKLRPHYFNFCILEAVDIPLFLAHYNDVIMTTIASPITSLAFVLLNRLFRRRSKKTSKLRVTGLCVGNSPGPVNSPHKGPVTRKMFPFDDVITQKFIKEAITAAGVISMV